MSLHAEKLIHYENSLMYTGELRYYCYKIFKEIGEDRLEELFLSRSLQYALCDKDRFTYSYKYLCFNCKLVLAKSIPLHDNKINITYVY